VHVLKLNSFMKKNIISVTPLVLITILSSCKVKNKELESSLFKHHERVQVTNDMIDTIWFMTVPETTDHFIKEAHGQDSILRLSYPSDWKLVIDPSFQFSASLDSTDVNQFVVVLRCSKIKSPIKNLGMYFDEVYNQVSLDTFERMTEFEFYEMTFESSSSILFGKMKTRVVSENYTILTCYFEDSDFIYDITLKRASPSFTNSDFKNFLVFLKMFKKNERRKINLAELTNIYRLKLKGTN
jgi:ribosome-binding factor A